MSLITLGSGASLCVFDLHACMGVFMHKALS